MTNKTFSIERGSNTIENVLLMDDNGNVMFEEMLDMDFGQITKYEHIEEFVVAAMNAVNESIGGSDEQTAITLVDGDGVFVWGLIIGPGENEGDIQYVFVDWQKDGKKFKYSDKPIDNEDAE